MLTNMAVRVPARYAASPLGTEWALSRWCRRSSTSWSRHASTLTTCDPCGEGSANAYTTAVRLDHLSRAQRAVGEIASAMAADHPTRLGLKLSPQNCTIEDLRGIWRLADESGFDHVWGFDHLNPIFSDHAGPIFEGMSLLAAMAQATSRVRIGLMVAGNTYRHPAVMAKMATTVDHLSGGRLEFGIGAAWAEFEHTTLGIPFYTTGQRIRRLGEACTVFKKLWTEETAVFDGRYYKLARALHNPQPVPKPDPPIWSWGSGER